MRFWKEAEITVCVQSVLSRSLNYFLLIYHKVPTCRRNVMRRWSGIDRYINIYIFFLLGSVHYGRVVHICFFQHIFTEHLLCGHALF